MESVEVSAKTVDEAKALMEHRDFQFTGDTVMAAKDFLLAHPACTSPKIGVIGFSMGAASVPQSPVVFRGSTGSALSGFRTRSPQQDVGLCCFGFICSLFPTVHMDTRIYLQLRCDCHICQGIYYAILLAWQKRERFRPPACSGLWPTPRVCVSCT